MLLQTEQLTKDYGRFRALDQLNLQVQPGEIVGILGPNGSGKSTALRLLLGFLRPTLGRATIAGYDCWLEGPQVRRQVAYLPGELRLYENMTGRQLLNFLGALRGQAPGPELARLAQVFDIDIDRKLTNLSSGMKRKVALLQVLVPHTPLVILDEPTNALDPSMRDQLLEQLLEAKRRGQAIVFSSHVLAEVERVCDRVALLQGGKLVHLQTMTELHEARRVQLTFTSPPPQPPVFPGLEPVGNHASEFQFDYRGPLPELLRWLTGLNLADVQLRPIGLASIYQRYHGAEA